KKTFRRKGVELKPSMNGGYKQVVLQNGGQITRKVHRLVAEAFIPNPDNLPLINHINGVKTDNRPENLEWCDHRHNVDHACRLGLMGKGEDLPFSKLTSEDIPVIRNLFRRGQTFDEIAPQFGVDRKTIIDVINKRTWKHIL